MTTAGAEPTDKLPWQLWAQGGPLFLGVRQYNQRLEDLGTQGMWWLNFVAFSRCILNSKLGCQVHQWHTYGHTKPSLHSLMHPRNPNTRQAFGPSQSEGQVGLFVGSSGWGQLKKQGMISAGGLGEKGLLLIGSVGNVFYVTMALLDPLISFCDLEVKILKAVSQLVSQSAIFQ